MKKWILTLKIIFSAGLLYYLFSRINLGTFLGQYLKIDTLMILWVVLIFISQYFLSTLKWKIILTADEFNLPFTFLFKSYLIGNFISLYLPSSFGGDVYRVLALKKYNTDLFKNASSVLFDRLTGLFALASIAIVSSTLFFREFIDYTFLGIYLAATFSFWILSSDKVLRYLNRVNSKLLSFFLKILESFNKYRSNYKVLILTIGISLIFQSNIVLINKLYCSALNIDIDLKYLYMVIPLIYLTEALPISINGLGVREGAFVLFFTKAGYSSEQALSVGLLVIGMRYIFSIITGGSLFFREFLASRASRKSKEVPA